MAEEESRERKRHDGREIMSRERDKGRRKKRVARERERVIWVTERDRSPDRERVIKREKKKEVEAEEGRQE